MRRLSGGEGAGDNGHPPMELAGVEIPGGFFSADPRLETAFIGISPTEIAYFTPRPADEVLAACAEIAGGAEPRRRIQRDHYFDTAGGSLSRQGASVRLRHYALHTRPLAFEVIAVSWRGARSHGPLKARTNHVLVQSFERNDEADYAAMLGQYERAGFRRLAEVGKTRTAFDVRPILYDLEGGTFAAGLDHRGLDGVRGWLRIHDLGVKVLVDELHEPAFGERTIVEVEYDRRHAAQAAEVAARIRAALGPGARAKERNKIAYLLAG
jgi:adenylate cyclase class IV